MTGSVARPGRGGARAAQLRAHMVRHPRPVRATYLAVQVCRDATTTEVLNTLAGMARRKHVERVGSGLGVRWQLTAEGRAVALAEGHPPTDNELADGRTPSHTFLPRRAAHNVARAARLPSDRDEARAAIACDTDAFLAAGGRIEQLGPTLVLSRIGLDDDAGNDD